MPSTVRLSALGYMYKVARSFYYSFAATSDFSTVSINTPLFFFLNDPPPTDISPLPLPAALPISSAPAANNRPRARACKSPTSAPPPAASPPLSQKNCLGQRFPPPTFHAQRSPPPAATPNAI